MDGWFALTKILKESLIYGRHKVSPKHMSGPVAFQSRAGHHLSYANTVRGRMGDSQSSLLKGWRCRKCGPSDVYAAILNEEESNYVVHKKQGECSPSRDSVFLGARIILVLQVGRLGQKSCCLTSLYQPILGTERSLEELPLF